MRMRRKKHGEERLERCSEYLLVHEGEPMTDPATQVFARSGAPVLLEIGAGKVHQYLRIIWIEQRPKDRGFLMLL